MWGNKAVMEGDEVVIFGIPQLAKTLSLSIDILQNIKHSILQYSLRIWLVSNKCFAFVI